MASDTGASYGSTLRYKSVERIKAVGKHSLIGASGEFSDFQEILRYLDELTLSDHMWDDGNSLGPKEVHSYLTRVMYNRHNKFDPLWNSLLLELPESGVPLADWYKGAGSASLGGLGDEMVVESGGVPEQGDATGEDGDVDDILKSIRVVTDVMESLVKRVIVAESEAANEKEKARVGLEEVRKKTIQVAVGTNGMLNEMRQRVEDMVLETTRQRQRAAENEQELSRVKQDFESLRTYVSTLVSVRETLLSSEKQFETMEKLFDRWRGGIAAWAGSGGSGELSRHASMASVNPGMATWR